MAQFGPTLVPKKNFAPTLPYTLNEDWYSCATLLGTPWAVVLVGLVVLEPRGPLSLVAKIGFDPTTLCWTCFLSARVLLMCIVPTLSLPTCLALVSWTLAL